VDDLAPSGYRCASCGARHDELPLSFQVPAPLAWTPEHANAAGSIMDDELCVILGEYFFVRGIIRIPILGHDEHFEWAVWTSLSRENFDRTFDYWETYGREELSPMFGWLAVSLPGYAESTLDLKTMVHTRPVGERHLVELEPTAHPLAVEQRRGITWDDVERRVAALLRG